MAIQIDLETIEKVSNTIIENLDPKYKDIVDPTGIDKLKEEIRNNPELQKYFKQ